MTTAQDLIAVHPFLAGMPDRYLERLSHWSHRSMFHAGSRIMREGDKADRFWLIRSGEIRLDAAVPDAEPILIDTLGAGTVLGWSWMFPPYRWRYGATATVDTLTIEFDGSGVRRVCEDDPRIGYELTRRFAGVLVERLQATRTRLHPA